MNLTEKPDPFHWPDSHYVFIEKIGPFQTTAQAAWGEVHLKLAEISQHSKIISRTSLYRVNPVMVYRAGVMLAAKPKHVPEGMTYEHFSGGDYARFTLTGSYSHLPEACGRVFEIVEETQMKVRDDFYIENYVNAPESTAEKELVTEILIPILQNAPRATTR